MSTRYWEEPDALVGYTRYLTGVTAHNEFEPFPKIPRFESTVWVTEKIDGTNAVIKIDELGNLLVGSRKRWIYPGKAMDNFGFAQWAFSHADELIDGLGHGTHHGEWWGQGIQRGYGLDHKRFSLFNVTKWNADTPPPACCHVVPVLYTGPLDQPRIEGVRALLESMGSAAAPGFMQPEGVMIYHERAGQYFKHPFDPNPKGAS